MKKIIFITLLLTILFISGCTIKKYNVEQISPELFCKKDSDCGVMLVNCGDFDCIAQEVKCINNICCGNYYILPYYTLDKKQYESDYLKRLGVSHDLSLYNINTKSDFKEIECAFHTAKQYKNLGDCETFENDIKVLCQNVVNSEKGYDEEEE